MRNARVRNARAFLTITNAATLLGKNGERKHTSHNGYTIVMNLIQCTKICRYESLLHACKLKIYFFIYSTSIYYKCSFLASVTSSMDRPATTSPSKRTRRVVHGARWDMLLPKPVKY